MRVVHSFVLFVCSALAGCETVKERNAIEDAPHAVTAPVASPTAPARPARWPTMGQAPFVGGGESDSAIIVAVGESAFLPAIADAGWSAGAWLRFFVKTLGVPQNRVTLLTDSSAMREAILEEATRAATNTTGRVWFIFIGNGAPTYHRDDGVLLDATANLSHKSFAERSVSERELLSILSSGTARDIVAIFDAPFLGFRRDGSGPLIEGSTAFMPLLRKPYDIGRSVVLSADEYIAASLPGMQAPAFSYLLLGALRGWADENLDGIVTAVEANTYVHGVLDACSPAYDHKPRFEAKDPLVSLARSAGESGPDVASLSCRSLRR